MFTKDEKKHNIGSILVGFTVLMNGMNMMSGAVKPLANVPEFTNILLMFQSPILGMAAGMILTAIVQSSSASVGILQALCVTGAVKYSAALPIIMGQNIGTCVTAIISSIGASKNARRAALIHLYFNLIGTVLFMAVFYAIHAVFPFAFMADSANAAGIAVIHTAFNLVATAALLPFSALLEKLAMLTIRDDETEERIDDFQLLDERFLAQPAFAVEQCRVVAGRMAQLTQEAILDAIALIGGEYTEEKAARIEALETKIDRYEDKLGTYMVKLSHEKLTREDTHAVSLMLNAINDFERISDHACNILDSAKEMHDKKLSFSDMADQELQIFANAVRDIVDRATKTFLKRDITEAMSIEPLEECIDELNVAIKQRHVDRLTAGQCTIELGFILSDICTNFERVADHCSNIAIYLIQLPNEDLGAHEYVNSLSGNAQFARSEHKFEEMYRLPEQA